jgi:hypothetical protein
MRPAGAPVGRIRVADPAALWHMVVIAIVRDGKIAKTTSYHAPPSTRRRGGRRTWSE